MSTVDINSTIEDSEEIMLPTTPTNLTLTIEPVRLYEKWEPGVTISSDLIEFPISLSIDEALTFASALLCVATNAARMKHRYEAEGRK